MDLTTQVSEDQLAVSYSKVKLEVGILAFGICCHQSFQLANVASWKVRRGQKSQEESGPAARSREADSPINVSTTRHIPHSQASTSKISTNIITEVLERTKFIRPFCTWLILFISYFQVKSAKMRACCAPPILRPTGILY